MSIQLTAKTLGAHQRVFRVREDLGATKFELSGLPVQFLDFSQPGASAVAETEATCGLEPQPGWLVEADRSETSQQQARPRLGREEATENVSALPVRSAFAFVGATELSSANEKTDHAGYLLRHFGRLFQGFGNGSKVVESRTPVFERGELSMFYALVTPDAGRVRLLVQGQV